MSELKKGMFGITSETKETNATPFLVATKVEGDKQFPNGWKFPTCTLVNVTANPAFEKSDKSVVAILDFVFVDADKRRHIHREWEQDPLDANFDKKHEGLTVRINHIYKAIFPKLPEGGIGTGASNYAEFFEAVSLAFNTPTVTIKVDGGEDKKVKYYTQVLLYYKCTYYKTNFGFPLSPNFLERVVHGKPCLLLTINPAFDILEPTKKAIPGIPGMSGGTDMPDNLPDMGGYEAGYS